MTPKHDLSATTPVAAVALVILAACAVWIIAPNLAGLIIVLF